MDGEAAVVGDFNEWDPCTTPLHRSNGWLKASVVVDPGRRYRFRYFADDGHWFNDPEVDASEPNGMGDDNSLLDLTAEGGDVGGSGRATGPAQCGRRRERGRFPPLRDVRSPEGLQLHQAGPAPGFVSVRSLRRNWIGGRVGVAGVDGRRATANFGFVRQPDRRVSPRTTPGFGARAGMTRPWVSSPRLDLLPPQPSG